MKSWNTSTVALLLVVLSVACLGLGAATGVPLYQWVAAALNLAALPLLVKAFREKRRGSGKGSTESVLPDAATRQMRRQHERQQRKRKGKGV